MNYATQHNIGNHHTTRTAAATAMAPPAKRIRELDAKAKGCKRSTQRQTESSTDPHVANGFLNCTFLPKLKETEMVQACRESDEMERDFFQSLSKLAA